MTKLKTVLENGGTVYLTGERSCCAPRNNSIVSFIQDVGGGDDVAIATSDAGSSSNILQSDFRTPNNITDVQYGSSGYFSVIFLILVMALRSLKLIIVQVRSRLLRGMI